MAEQQYIVSFTSLFQSEFENFPEDDQLKVVKFVETYEQYGLEDFSQFPGKIAPSWKVDPADPKASDKERYAKENYLWHYHIGIPEFIETDHNKYFTSDWVLHFINPPEENTIILVDMYKHYTYKNEFYLPTPEYLVL